jgi:hypothetical protein
MRKTANKKFNLKSKFDAFGSYTGISNENENEIPVQDADDL